MLCIHQMDVVPAFHRKYGATRRRRDNRKGESCVEIEEVTIRTEAVTAMLVFSIHRVHGVD